MLNASDISIDMMQLLAYVLIGLLSGLCGVAFVKLNQRYGTGIQPAALTRTEPRSVGLSRLRPAKR